MNWFGLVRGKIFGEPPLYVDRTKAPGETPIPPVTITNWLRNAPFVLVTSPNFVWAVLSLLVYFGKPYQLATVTAPLSITFMNDRLPLWLALTFGYSTFWHLTLYGFNWASRPYIKNRVYNYDKVAHNIFWSLSGVVIWTMFENVFCYLWASGRLPYIADAESFGTVGGGLRFAAALAGVPVWRSIHFYFAHRLLHFGPLYQQVHSLHHRNTDTEPFSGLCMHPVEHLYYYACVLPSLVFLCSPYAFVWNGVHLLLSPSASHSGYEDHFQSDTFHYLHHRYFECNYAGGDAAFMDIWFGTFRDRIMDHAPREDAKSTLRTVPTKEFLAYLGGSAACFLPLILGAEVVSSSVVAGFGPVILAPVVSTLFHHGLSMRVKMSAFGNMFHVLIGALFCSVPISYICYLTNAWFILGRS